jgi:hypothetical protein
MTESRLTRRYCEVMARQGAVCVPMVGTEMSMAGLPDRLIVHRAATFWVEAKGPRGRVRPLQAEMIRRLRERGQVVVVARYSPDGTTCDMDFGNVVREGVPPDQIIDTVVDYAESASAGTFASRPGRRRPGSGRQRLG